MKVILGSGLIGNLAKMIHGEGWEWMPFKRSRYYSFEIPFADNHIVFDKNIDDFVGSAAPSSPPIFAKCPISYMGQLMFQDLPICIQPYLQKVYGDQVPTLAQQLTKTTYTTYQTTAHVLLQKAERRNKEAIDAGVAKFKDVLNIDLKNHIIKCKGGDFQYDSIINTIPLDAFYQLCGMSFAPKAKSVCLYHIISDAVDLEGADQCLVADPDIKFFKVTAVPGQRNKHHYLFWTFDPVDNPYQYFGSVLNYKLEIEEAKRIENMIPIGNPPDLSELESGGVYCVGSNAQWDDYMDVASCIKRLLSLVGKA